MKREISRVGDGWGMNLREGGPRGHWFRNLERLWLQIRGQRDGEKGLGNRYRRRRLRGAVREGNVGNDFGFGAGFGGQYRLGTMVRSSASGFQRGEERGVGTRSKLRWGRAG